MSVGHTPIAPYRFLAIAISVAMAAALFGTAGPASAETDTTFTVTIENVSTPETLTTSTGSVAVPLSPGAYVIGHEGRNALLDPRDHATAALEALAEDGNPAGFPDQVPGSQVFNTPDGASEPGPILPGGSYTFSFTAEPGDELSLVTMFVQSNDWFYSTLSDERGVALFDAAGVPRAGDISDQFKLWQSGTEVDEEPGVGAHQAPRQSAPNQGTAESRQVISLSTLGIHVPLNGPVMKVTLSANDHSDAPDDGDSDSDGGDNDDGDDLPDFLEALAVDGRFTTLLAALEASFLEPPSPGEQFTLFAPTDDAFAQLPDGLLEELLADPGRLTDALVYHLVEGNFDAATLLGLDGVITLLGAPVALSNDGGELRLNGTTVVVDADIEVSEGVIHAIDSVLQPPEFVGFLAADFARGSTEVPGPGDPGSLTLNFVDITKTVDGEYLFCFNATTTVPDPTIAHIHRGAAGVAGDVVVNPGFDAESWAPDGFNPAANVAQGCAGVEPDLAEEIIAGPEAFYFNLHSTTFPAGANREQLIDATDLNEFPRAYTAAPMLGSNEVPGPGDPASGRGFVDFSIPTTANGDLCYRSTIFRTGEITSGHIHTGAAGVAGDVLVDLEIGSVWPVTPHGSAQGWNLEGCSPAGDDALAAIAADPVGHYVNLHNAEFPAGAVRAQLVAGVGETVILAELEPSDGVEGFGFMNLAVFPEQGLLCWDTPFGGPLEPSGISLQGPDGAAVTIDYASHPFLPDTGSPDVQFTSFGCQSVDEATLLSIVGEPGEWNAIADTVEQPSAFSGPLFNPFGPPPGPDAGDDLVELQILAINDFHGNIATTSSAFGGVGRADFLAANMAAAEAEADNSVIVSAGDLIGASPLISALFHDEPTIEAMNLIGLDINAVGNHEFDEGAEELIRMQEGGSHPIDGDLDDDGFEGADFDFLAANVVDDASGETIFAPYTVKEYERVPVAFIGMTLEGTPTIVTPAGVAGLTFNDEVETVNALIPELKAQGIEAIVVLLHEGGLASEGGGDGDGCGTVSGPLFEIVTGLDDAVDLVIGGHNNQRFVCPDVGGKAVTMAYHSGRMFTDIDTTLDPATGEMTIVAIDNKENFQEGVTPDATLTALIDRYDALSAPLANAVIGSTTGDILREGNDAGESPLGDIIADAQLAATASAGTGEAVVAFMNPGGIRGDLLAATSEGGEAAGEVTFGEAFGIQPFGNSLVTMTLTGEQIHTLLTQQWVGQEPDRPRILQVSEGFSYTWDAAAADEDKVDASSIMIDGVAVEPTGEYRVTVNSFLSDGGDNFAVLSDGTNRLGGDIDLDALVDYFRANTPVAPGPQDRISLLGGAAT